LRLRLRLGVGSAVLGGGEEGVEDGGQDAGVQDVGVGFGGYLPACEEAGYFLGGVGGGVGTRGFGRSRCLGFGVGRGFGRLHGCGGSRVG
jgi:hypothetical protein